MNKPTLVIMAAGMGSRYGGLKQIDPIGPNGEIIMDYSIYDAINAGFEKVVFIIKKENEQLFKECIGDRIAKKIKTKYVFQSTENVPDGFEIPKDRIKPWGTGHAVLCCKGIVNEPFAVINADDFYGKASFELLADFLKNCDVNSYDYTMAGFILENTLTENGHVARGVCQMNEDDFLIDVTERVKIQKNGAVTQYTEDDTNWVTLPKGSTVSMNCWGFTPTILNELEKRFPLFLEKNKENILKAEFFLPFVVDELIKENKAKVKVQKTSDKWYGVTYKEDKEEIVSAISQMIKDGKYPEKL